MPQDGEHKRHSSARSYLHGLHHSARENVSAYGYSVTITASFGLLATIMGSPSVLEVFVFAGGAIFGRRLGGGCGLQRLPTPTRGGTQPGASSGWLDKLLLRGLCTARLLLAGQMVGGFIAWPL